ncbi:AMP-dependent synthetase [Yeosuana aromativorans]|uniref:AMP-dependent synthetase n=1 Tax=Yeosuana aromativorans TaxID=288019 RepID=A0A8J3BIK6_9FLAO|nr:AMP-binding protein [Yeosuana aromativorans]GGK16854.1 AMP-dependent synthetase [Yeosuana aromativorans]
MLKFNSPLEAFLYWETQTPNAVFLKQPVDGKVVSYSFSKVGEEARKIALALKELQLPEQSHIALLSKNCAHWVMADLAIMMAGYVSIPIYPTLHADSIHQILEHSESKAIIIGKLDNFELQKSGIPNIPKISVSLYGVKESMTWEELLNNQNTLQEIKLPKPDNLHTIIYTSGTTGNPKGVMHTVGNFVESISTLATSFNLSNHSTLFSYLPLAHVAERVFITGGIMLGSQISFSESLETFAKDLESTQPHVFFAVPRIWTKFQEKILENMPQNKLNVLLKIPLLNTIIKNKIKQKLGLKHAKYIASAAAPLSSSLCKWYNRLDITIYQGYGMTEDCCVSHFNLPGFNKIGTVGRKLNHVQIKLSQEGEILIKNNCLMLGYFKAPDITASVFDDDGYFKTGDIGEYDHEGFLTITGRIKDQFKTDKGKYISPGPIELDMSKNTDIEQICVVGTGIPQPIALITLSELGKSKSKADLCSGLINTLEQISPNYEKHEKIEKVVIMKEDWNVDNGLTTPTLKVKRNSIEKILTLLQTMV